MDDNDVLRARLFEKERLLQEQRELVRRLRFALDDVKSAKTLTEAKERAQRALEGGANSASEGRSDD
jgi:hypothetical protein